MKTESTFTDADWDFVSETANGSNDYWDIDGSTNNGYPFFYFQKERIEWDGSSSTDWNTAANWSTDAVPTSSDNIIITNQANDPVVDEAVGSPAACQAIIIESGATLDINPGKALTVSGNITNNGTITINSDATGTGSLITEGSVTGDVNVEMYLTGSNDASDPTGRHWYFSAPISDATANVFAPLSVGNYNKLWSHTEGNTQYAQITNTGDALTAVKGYVVRPWENSTFTLTGTLNTGNQGANNNCAVSEGETKAGWNLIGNPYPSAIDWASGTGITRTNVYNTIVFRTGDVGSRTFNTYNGTGGVGTFGGSNAGIIPAMQGFWVIVDGSSTGGVEFTNDCRVHNTQAFYKNNEEETVEHPIIRLNLQAENDENIDANVIYFHAEASDEFDAYDSPKFDPDIAHLYTSTVEESKLAINGLNNQDITSKTIPLGFKTKEAGLYTITAASIANFELGTTVLLEDTETGDIVELDNNSTYTFTTDGAYTGMRFKVLFGIHTDVQGIENQEVVNVYGYNKQVYIYTERADAEITVYDLSGKQVAQTKATSQLTKLPIAQSGLYIVKVQSNENTTVQKVSVY